LAGQLHQVTDAFRPNDGRLPTRTSNYFLCSGGDDGNELIHFDPVPQACSKVVMASQILTVTPASFAPPFAMRRK
jgi:hypothetical protein